MTPDIFGSGQASSCITLNSSDAETELSGGSAFSTTSKQ